MTYFKQGFVLIFVLVASIVSASAAGDPIANRKAMMQTVGASTKAAGAMLRGKVPYDAVKAELAMRAINAAASAFGQYFPANSKTGGKTTAAPKIWEDMAGFMKITDNLAVTSAAGIKAAKAGEGAFKAAFGAMAKNCKQCHQTYRVKKK